MIYLSVVCILILLIENKWSESVVIVWLKWCMNGECVTDCKRNMCWRCSANINAASLNCRRSWSSTCSRSAHRHTVSEKPGMHIMPHDSRKWTNFNNFFHYCILRWTVQKDAIRSTTSPQICCHTTLWKFSVELHSCSFILVRIMYTSDLSGW